MNKIINLLFFFILVSVMLHSQTIKVNQPVEGDIYCNTDAVNIGWSKIGSQGNVVKILLYDDPRWPGAKPRLIITPGTPNEGFYPVPAGTFKNLPTRKYKIVIKVKNEPVVGRSGTITIRDCIKFPQIIKVINPHKGNIWKRGESHIIKWNNQFTRNKKVTLQLIKHPGKKLIKNIASFHSVSMRTTSNISQHPWTVPSELGGSYRIKIFVSSHTARGISGVFHVPMETKTTTFSIPVTAVNQGWVTKSRGAPQDIRTGYWVNEFGNPGPRRMRVGFSNHLFRSGDHIHALYRSLLKIDINPYKNKGFLLKASLIFNITNRYNSNQSTPAACNPGIRLYIPEEAWNGSIRHIFEMRMSRHSSIKDVTVIVRDWLLGRKPNYGLLFVGPNELTQKNSQSCVSYSDDVVLELQFQEKV